MSEIEKDKAGVSWECRETCLTLTLGHTRSVSASQRRATYKHVQNPFLFYHANSSILLANEVGARKIDTRASSS